MNSPFWFVACFLVVWIASAAALSLLSGWWSLAARFAAKDACAGQRMRFVAGAVGAGLLPVGYGRALTLTVGEQGICLEVMILLRVLSPRLCITWDAMASVEEKRSLFRRYTAIRIRDHWAGIMLYGEAGRRVLAAYGSRTA